MGGGGNKIKETPLERELASIGVERYERYAQRYIPAEDYLINDITGNYDNRVQQAQGMSGANYEQSFAPGVSATASNAGARNAGSLDSGSGKLGLVQYGTDKGFARGLGSVDTRLNSELGQANNIQSLVNIGQGKSNQALQGLSEAASVSGRQAILDAQAKQAARNAIGNTIGTVAGLGYGYMSGPSTGAPTVQSQSAAGLSGIQDPWSQFKPTHGKV